MIKNGIYKYIKDDGTEQLFLFIDETSVGFWSVYEYTGTHLDKTVLKTYNHNRIDHVEETLQMVTTLAADKEEISMVRIIKALFWCNRAECWTYVIANTALVTIFILVTVMSENSIIKTNIHGNIAMFVLTVIFFAGTVFAYRQISEMFYYFAKQHMGDKFPNIRLKCILSCVGDTYFDIDKKKTL